MLSMVKVQIFSDVSLANFKSTQGFIINGGAEQDYSGYAVAKAGDFNGDGFDDVIIGAYGVDIGSQIDGACYIIFGTWFNTADIDLSVLTTAQGFKISGVNQGDYTGYSVSSAGDFNGDGYGDIIIGAYGSNNLAGTSYLLYGKFSGFSDITLSTLTNDKGFKINGEVSGDKSGFAVGCAGDINNDGYSDIIIGAHFLLLQKEMQLGLVILYLVKKTTLMILIFLIYPHLRVLKFLALILVIILVYQSIKLAMLTVIE